VRQIDEADVGSWPVTADPDTLLEVGCQSIGDIANSGLKWRS
jgi:hypothetical protein